MQNPKKLRLSPVRIFHISFAAYAILLGLIIWVFYAEPLTEKFSAYVNDALFDIFVMTPAIGAAIAGSLLTRQFEKGETPYRIWLYFAIGLWFWVAGEVGGMVNDYLYWEAAYPDFGFVDAFWLLGYFFLGLSLYLQLRAVLGSENKTRRRLYLGVVVLALLVTAGLTSLAERAGLGEGSAWIILFVTVLYPVFDLAEGATAIWLSFLFGRGHWTRPWWGLILFALADSIDTFYWLGGYDRIPVLGQDVLNFVTLLVYPASYMAAGLALLSNYFILRYGEDSGMWKLKKKRNAQK